MADPFVAEIRIYGFNFAPTGWAFCNGQLLPISQNTALFSLLGTMYGGDGKSTFALPDLQGNAPLFWGQSTGSDYVQGQVGGTDFVTLISSEMPSHVHQMRADTLDPADANIPSPTSSYGQSTGGTLYQDNPADPQQFLDPANATQFVGGSLPHNNMMPFLTLNFCIALQGIFPPRG